MRFTPNPPNSPAYRAAEQAVGNVPAYLTMQRGQGTSYAEISLLLYMHGVTVSYETVRAWCQRFEIDTTTNKVAS
jgi:transposase-like protein